MANFAIVFALFVCQIVFIAADFSNKDCGDEVQGTFACKGHFLVYKYDVTKGQCIQAVYGGCNPTNNNFAKKSDCEAIAVPICREENFFTKEDCSKDIEGEYSCKALIAVYKWDDNKQACVQAVYGGCNPTKNNFREKADCDKYAAPVCKR